MSKKKEKKEDIKQAKNTHVASLLLHGRQAVREALRNGHVIQRIYLQEGAQGNAQEILTLAAERGVPVSSLEREQLGQICREGRPLASRDASREETPAHQGVVALATPYEYVDLETILKGVADKGEDPLLVLLDGLEDPHNLGAILRSAECAGAHGVVIPERRSAHLTSAVAKASAGAIEYVPVAQVKNMVRTIETLQDRGLWVAACDMGEEMYYQRDLTGPLAIVIGGEGKGVSRLVKERCDYTVSIPLKGKIASLNASNAAAVVLFEVCRQREKGV